MIGLVIGQVDLQKIQTSINGVDEAEAACQGMQGADAAVGDAAVTFADFVMDVGGGEHGLIATLAVELVEPA